MISEAEARELHTAISMAVETGNVAGLVRAREIAIALLTMHLPEWRWENGSGPAGERRGRWGRVAQ